MPTKKNNDLCSYNLLLLDMAEDYLYYEILALLTIQNSCENKLPNTDKIICFIMILYFTNTYIECH